MTSQQQLVAWIHEKLNRDRDSLSHQWRNPQGTQTRHFVVDDLLPPEICARIYHAFPKNAEGFHRLDSFRERKRTSVNLNEYEPILGAVTYALQDRKIVDWIARLADFEHIEPDPQLYAGGLSMMFRGDFLNPHLDNSHDAERGRYRRLNLLFYVSPDWTLESGGNFELWDDARTIPKTVVARANRLIVMETTKRSWHSVSPLQADGPRCCVSNYYFSKISPDGDEYFHVTSFTGRPEEKFKRLASRFDNALRGLVSKTLKIGRGRYRLHRPKS